MANLSQIETYLKEKDIPYEVIDLGEEVYTVDQVKKSGVEEDEIVKTLIIRVEGFLENNQQNMRRSSKKVQYVALAVRGKDRVDFKKVRKLLGPSASLRVNCELAKPDEVLKVVGVPVGAVCPILIDLALYIDRRVMDITHVNMGSGDLTRGLDMNCRDLLKAVGKYKVADLVK